MRPIWGLKEHVERHSNERRNPRSNISSQRAATTCRMSQQRSINPNLACKPSHRSPLKVHCFGKTGGNESVSAGAHSVSFVTHGDILAPDWDSCKHPCSMTRGQKFATWFQSQLRRREWTPADFALRADMNPQTVSKWIRGDRVPSPASCDLIADALAVDFNVVMYKAGHSPMQQQARPDDPALEFHGYRPD